MAPVKSRNFLSVFRDSLAELMKNDPLRMAAATAFFTTFALPPILVILIQAFRLFLDPRTIRVELFQSLSGILGREAVRQVVGVLRAIRDISGAWYITVGGFIFLLFVATTLFKIIKNSINQVWKIRVTEKHGLAMRLRTRVQAFLVILFAGLLFVIGVMMEAIQVFISNYISEYSPVITLYFNTILNHLISIIIVTVWFAMVFRYLPDGRPDWSIALTGGFFTSVLFTIGKVLLRWLLGHSNVNDFYGTSASIVLLLLFVFYSSLILYYGAAFTRQWGEYKGRPIKPLPHAKHYRISFEERE